MTKPKASSQREKPAGAKPSLTSPTGRSRFDARNAPYWVNLDPGQALGYRKGARKSTWLARLESPREQTILGLADDGLEDAHMEADGIKILTHQQAKEAAEAWFKAKASVPEGQKVILPGHHSVGDALMAYLKLQESKGLESIASTRSRINKTISEIGHIKLSELNSTHLTDWMGRIILEAPKVRGKAEEGPQSLKSFNPANEDHIRRRQSTANRALGDVKAALQQVFSGENKWIDSDLAWRKVTPFEQTLGIRDAVMDLTQQASFLNSCTPEFRPLAYASLLTGQRYGPLRRLKVKDFQPLDRVIRIGKDKHGRNRYAPLTDEAVVVFWSICEGRGPEEYLLVQTNGKPWSKSNQQRPMSEGAKAVDLNISLYGLRHTCITVWLIHGIPAALIAEATNTSIKMIQDHYKHLDPEHVGQKINEKAPKLGLHQESAAILEKIEGLRSKRVTGELALTFDLASLHPSRYVGKVKGGLVDPSPAPLRPTKDELSLLIEEMPATAIAKTYGVSSKAVEKWCLKWGITRPGRGYWARRRSEERYNDLEEPRSVKKVAS